MKLLQGDQDDRRALPARGAAWAWVAAPAFLLAMAGMQVADLRTPLEAPHLLAALNLAFALFVCALVAYLAAASFQESGSPGILALGAGAVVTGATFLLVSLATDHRESLVAAIHGPGLLAAGLLHVTGAGLLRRENHPVKRIGFLLGASYAGSLAVVILTGFLAHQGVLPPFFVEGHGGTPLRQSFLAGGIALFTTASLLMLGQARGTFRRWYAAGLLLLGVGLVGAMFQSTPGSPISWAGWGAQYLGGIYLLVAARSAASASHRWGLPLQAALQEADVRYAALESREQQLASALAANQELLSEVRVPKIV